MQTKTKSNRSAARKAGEREPRSYGTMGMLPISEVARRTGVSSGFIYKEIRAGRLQSIQFSPRLWRVHESALAEYVEKAKAGAGASS